MLKQRDFMFETEETIADNCILNVKNGNDFKEPVTFLVSNMEG